MSTQIQMILKTVYLYINLLRGNTESGLAPTTCVSLQMLYLTKEFILFKAMCALQLHDLVMNLDKKKTVII